MSGWVHEVGVLRYRLTQFAGRVGDLVDLPGRGILNPCVVRPVTTKRLNKDEPLTISQVRVRGSPPIRRTNDAARVQETLTGFTFADSHQRVTSVMSNAFIPRCWAKSLSMYRVSSGFSTTLTNCSNRRV